MTWTHSGTPAATEFRVYMGTTSGVDAGVPIATVILGLTNQTTYFFVVRAYASVESANSNELSATLVLGLLLFRLR